MSPVGDLVPHSRVVFILSCTLGALVAAAILALGYVYAVMSFSARVAFALFTDQEIADIYTFLRTHHGLE